MAYFAAQSIGGRLFFASTAEPQPAAQSGPEVNFFAPAKILGRSYFAGAKSAVTTSTAISAPQLDGAAGTRPRKRKHEPAVEVEQPITREMQAHVKKQQKALEDARTERDRNATASREALRQQIKSAAKSEPAAVAPKAKIVAPAWDDEDEELLLLMM